MLTKKEFKKQYHILRKARFEFNVRLENGNFPCGHDDMLCERFSEHEHKFLEDKPYLKYVIENSSMFNDILKDKEYTLNYYRANNYPEKFISNEIKTRYQLKRVA